MNLNYVRFDVGHYFYVSHRSTIERFPDSVLAKYIAPEFDVRQTGLDYIVIDRDGRKFGTILNYMRDPTLIKLDDWSDNEICELMREADFYCLTELAELCSYHLEVREKARRQEREAREPVHVVPPNNKLEIIYGSLTFKALMLATKKRSFVVSYQNMRRHNFDSWVEDMLRLSDFTKFNIYCVADKNEEEIFSERGSPIMSKDIFVALHEPMHPDMRYWVPMPAAEKFRVKRTHYKCKLFKFLFLVHNGLIHNMMRSR